MIKYYRILLVVLAFASLVGCISSSARTLDLKVTFAGNASQSTLHYAKVISGGDKIRWYGLETGKVYNATLYPGEVSDTRLTLFYKLKETDTEVIWESKNRDSGSDWAIKLTITPEKTVQEAACMIPCTLE